MKLFGYTLNRTSYACPEQYDVFDSNKKKVGYMRLRHGFFRVDILYPIRQTIYSSDEMHGDGIFDDIEREHFLKQAILALDKQIKKQEKDNK